jgi:hypothetical protein
MRLPNNHGLDRNALVLPPIPSYSEAGVGQICLANEALMTDETFSVPLTYYSVGYRDPENNQALVNFLSPDVQVGRLFEFKQHNNAEEFYTEADDIRAIGAEFKRIDYSGSTQFNNTLNKGLGFRYDMDYVSRLGVSQGTYLEDPTVFQQRIVAKILRRLWRNEAVRTVTMAVAAAVNTNVTWSAATGEGPYVYPDPEGDVMAAADAAQLVQGIYPNRLLYAKDAWTKRFKGLGLDGNAARFGSRSLTPQQVADITTFDSAMISRSVYQASSASKARLLSNLVLMFLAMDGVDQDDPTNFKRFTTPTESGPYRVYVNNYGKFVDIFVELYSRIVATSTIGVASLTVS